MKDTITLEFNCLYPRGKRFRFGSNKGYPSPIRDARGIHRFEGLAFVSEVTTTGHGIERRVTVTLDIIKPARLER